MRLKSVPGSSAMELHIKSSKQLPDKRRLTRVTAPRVPRLQNQPCRLQSRCVLVNVPFCSPPRLSYELDIVGVHKLVTGCKNIYIRHPNSAQLSPLSYPLLKLFIQTFPVSSLGFRRKRNNIAMRVQCNISRSKCDAACNTQNRRRSSA